jgi:hypothetical protein
MATRELKPTSLPMPPGESLISFDEAMELLSRDDRFKATVYAMNTLLVQKGIYSPDEFEFHFRQWAQKQTKK